MFRWNYFGFVEINQELTNIESTHIIYFPIGLPVALIERYKMLVWEDFDTTISRYIERKIKENG